MQSGADDSTKSIHELNSSVLGLTADSSVTNDDLVKQLIAALGNLTGDDSSGAHSSYPTDITDIANDSDTTADNDFRETIFDLFDPDGVVDTIYENIARGDGALYSENTISLKI